MKKYILCLFLFFIPLVLVSQEKETPKDNTKIGSSQVKTQIPVQAQYSNKFAITKVNFNKKIDVFGRGEILEIEFVLKNLTDDPMDLYLFTIATYENKYEKESYFDMPIPPAKRMANFIPYPFNIENFRYPKTDFKGKQIMEKSGKQAMKYIKFPKNPKEGINPKTGKPYNLKEKVVIRTYHLSKYRVNYTFFNEATLLIFDTEGKPVFRQLFKFTGYRR